MQGTDNTRRFAQGAVGAGRYQLEEYLGGAGLFEVHRAVDRRLGRPVLVTLVPHGRDQAAEQRFHEDIRRLATVSHPGLVAVHDSGVEGAQGYLVTELVDAEPLSHRVSRQLLTPEETMELGGSVADLLATVHHLGITHRDINPSNILMGRDGRARLTGFGLSGFADPGRPPGSGAPAGAPAVATAFQAPEQQAGRDAGPAGDVYSLGVVLLHGLTGELHQPGTDHRGGLQPVPIPPNLPMALGRALQGMTQLDPAARPAAGQVAAMLGRPAMAEPAEEPFDERREPPDSRALRYWLIGGALFVLAILIAILLMSQDWGSDEPTPTPSEAPAAPTGQAPVLPHLPGVTQLPHVDLPSPPSVNMPDMPSVPNVPDVQPGDVFQRIKDWFKSWG